MTLVTRADSLSSFVYACDCDGLAERVLVCCIGGVGVVDDVRFSSGTALAHAGNSHGAKAGETTRDRIVRILCGTLLAYIQ